MIFREATINDIPQIQLVRHSVKENILSNPTLVTDKDCEIYLVNRDTLFSYNKESDISLNKIMSLLYENRLYSTYEFEVNFLIKYLYKKLFIRSSFNDIPIVLEFKLFNSLSCLFLMYIIFNLCRKFFLSKC